MSNETFLTVEDAADRLQVSLFTMRKWLRLGRVRGVKVGKVWRIPESSLTTLAESATKLSPLAMCDHNAPESLLLRMRSRTRLGPLLLACDDPIDGDEKTEEKEGDQK